MTEITLTSEQRAVIHHPGKRHARVLAVAGSGKTMTMAHRIRHLVMVEGVTPTAIRVLMFNRLARNQFRDRLGQIGIPGDRQPQVHTFHSFAYQFIRSMRETGLIPGEVDFWLEDKEELARIYVLRAISNLVRGNTIPLDSVDPDEAGTAIDLWKGSLIPPQRAGYRGNDFVPLVYQEYERLRFQAMALTYADFVPIAVGFLETNERLNRQWCNSVDHIIVDEYQDVNFGQQRLIELLAGERADVMVVGDDDQTIYEWRGARPSYIVREFRSVFAGKRHVDYTLSRSFRFGPVIAQCAHNVIGFNTNRVDKPLTAHFVDRVAHIDLVTDSSEQPVDVNKELAEQVIALVKAEKVPPKQIIVLARMFVQLSGLQSEFLSRQIPFRVVGQRPFFERTEITALLDYLRLACRLADPVTDKSAEQLLRIANRPSRKLGRKHLAQAMRVAQRGGISLARALKALANDPSTPFNTLQRERVEELAFLLERIGERIRLEPELTAGALLTWLVDVLDYYTHFDNYYGRGEDSVDRKGAVGHFVGYAGGTQLKPLEFVQHIDSLDPTRGAPRDQQIVMTTVFRTKGLEYDYVIIPECVEGYMPCLYETGNRIYDRDGLVDEPEPSQALENERRLFYVAVTRAKKAVFIGTSAPPAHGSQARSAVRLPSRFIDEMQHEPTAAVMASLQQLGAGVPESRSALTKAVTQYGARRRLMQNLIAGYLARLDDPALAGEVTSLLARAADQPFSYRHAYPAVEVIGAWKRPASPQLHSAWDDVES